jgi:hypothetical protein
MFEGFLLLHFLIMLDIRHSLSLGLNYDIFKNVKVSVGSFFGSDLLLIVGNETVQTGNETMVQL